MHQTEGKKEGTKGDVEEFKKTKREKHRWAKPLRDTKHKCRTKLVKKKKDLKQNRRCKKN